MRVALPAEMSPWWELCVRPSAPHLQLARWNSGGWRDRPPKNTQKRQNLMFIKALNLYYSGFRRPFVVAIFAAYPGVRRRTASGEIKLELESTPNDAKFVLDYFGYLHNDTSRTWYVLADFKFVYTDMSGKTQEVPTIPSTKFNILDIISKATSGTGPGYIHVGCHCYIGGPGSSRLDRAADGTAIYIEYEEEEPGGTEHDAGSETAYIVSCDGERLYGKDFYEAFQGAGKTTSPITVFFDMCNAAAFLDHIADLPFVVNASYNNSAEKRNSKNRDQRQLIFIHSSQRNQNAGTVKLSNSSEDGDLCLGAVTYLLYDYLTDYPSASAAQVVEYVNARCATRYPSPEQSHLCQTVSILSRYPLEGPLQLLQPRDARSGLLRRTLQATRGFVHIDIPPGRLKSRFSRMVETTWRFGNRESV